MKLEAEGINVIEAKNLLDAARLKIGIAASSTALIKIEANEFMSENASSTATSTNYKNEYRDIKNAVEKAKKDIKAAHAALVDVINSLKPGRNKPKTATSTPPTATTTATTTVSN